MTKCNSNVSESYVFVINVLVICLGCVNRPNEEGKILS